jgi:putative acetyltransferase
MPITSNNQLKVQRFGDIVIRKATNEDKERVVALVFAVLSEFGLQGDLESTDSDLNNIERNYLEAGGLFELLEDVNGNLQGTYGLFPLDEETLELRKMYLVPQLRGLGLGLQILERCRRYARAQGFKAIRLETISVLKRAIRLYIQFGFVPTETTHRSSRVDQTYILKLEG